MIFKNFPQGIIFTGALLGLDIGGAGFDSIFLSQFYQTFSFIPIGFVL